MVTRSLARLFSELTYLKSSGPDMDPFISSITADSRLVQPGGLFVALSGEKQDGHQFIAAAISAGAAAVVGEKSIPEMPVPYLVVENTRKVLAQLSAAFYDYPARKMTMIGITGTDGKTTTCNILYQILIAAGYRTGMISTVNAVIGTEILDTGFHVTTPDAPDVQGYLARMFEAGITHVILETTSHGWAQFRVDACEFDIGIVTNITHEHLDYHHSYENYRAAKARLFTSLSETVPKGDRLIGLGVLNQGDSSFDYLHQVTLARTISYGLTESAYLRAEKIQQTPDGTRFTVCVNDSRFEVKTHLHGDFNVLNCLAAISAARVGLGIDPNLIAQGIANLPGVPGRMERIDLGQKFSAIVDFAHTPNALKVSLETARQMLVESSEQTGQKIGRLIAVFGSAGFRDKEKRRMLAEISVELADISILTAEDPRTESLANILDEMAVGARNKGGVEGQSFWRVSDRGEAIRLAFKFAKPGDIVISCGKGHEQSMCFGTTEYPWDDRTAMQAALAETMGLVGPRMPYLPTQDQL